MVKYDNSLLIIPYILKEILVKNNMSILDIIEETVSNNSNIVELSPCKVNLCKIKDITPFDKELIKIQLYNAHKLLKLDKFFEKGNFINKYVYCKEDMDINTIDNTLGEIPGKPYMLEHHKEYLIIIIGKGIWKYMSTQTNYRQFLLEVCNLIHKNKDDIYLSKSIFFKKLLLHNRNNSKMGHKRILHI